MQPAKLTIKQFETLQAIEKYRAANGESPTLTELMGLVGITLWPLRERLKRMRTAGAVASEYNKFRTLRVLIPCSAFVQVGDRYVQKVEVSND